MSDDLPLDSPIRRLARATIATALVDALFSSTLAVVAYGTPAARVWTGVASTILGPSALNGGAAMVALGLVLHVEVALTWSLVLMALSHRSRRIAALLATRRGTFAVAAIYGACVWTVMSLLVIPLLVHREPGFSARWWVQLAGHVPFVGLPIAWGIGYRARHAASRRLPAAP